MSSKKIWKLISFPLVIMLILLTCPISFATELERTSDQYMELKVVSITGSDGNKQVLMEWWSYNLVFKGLELRFSYDSTKLEPSSVSDNSSITESNEISSPTTFVYTSDFSDYMVYQVVAASNGTYQCYMSIENPPTDDTDYIRYDDDLDGYVVDSTVNGRRFIRNNEF